MEKFLLTAPSGSQGGTALARALGVTKLTKARQATFKGSDDKIIINWGNSNPIAEVLKCKILNAPDAIKTAVNKLTALRNMAGGSVSVPQFTEHEEIAKGWVKSGRKVVARHILTGSSGDGIQILSSVDDFPCAAPLYVRYIPKKSEYRFHVMNGKVFDFQRKMRRKDIPDDKVNWLIRNHSNGFIYGREGPMEQEVYEILAKHSVKAVKVLGLDFGAVDVIWNDRHQQGFVLEVNTAPGLEGQTIQNYSNAFIREYFGINRWANPGFNDVMPWNQRHVKFVIEKP